MNEVPPCGVIVSSDFWALIKDRVIGEVLPSGNVIVKSMMTKEVPLPVLEPIPQIIPPEVEVSTVRSSIPTVLQ
jgi:hypothetical protein